MRVWEPCLQVMDEPVAVTKNELKKKKEESDAALQILARRVLGRTKRGWWQGASSKEKKGEAALRLLAKSVLGEDRARLMEGGKEQGARGKEQGARSKEQGKATLRLLAIILLFLLHYSTQAPYGPSGHKDAPKGHHPIAQGSVLGRASQEEIAPCRGRIMRPPPYSSISARLFAKLWMKLLEVSMGA